MKKYEYIYGGFITIDEKNQIIFSDLIYTFPLGANILEICEKKKNKFERVFNKYIK